jgi:hypothetical protein
MCRTPKDLALHFLRGFFLPNQKCLYPKVLETQNFIARVTSGRAASAGGGGGKDPGDQWPYGVA